ncbi:hypothetical protein ACO0LC_27330 [Undibacterium sp. JH2W]|uniref:hypothetical protein n=1 Tax=Undibacterium sp. JH2W TaxID=3413037 RepID=UPI003BF42C10
MLSIPLNISKLMISALTEEIERLKLIGDSCEDDWPGDYDPNDVPLYEYFRRLLEENPSGNTILHCEKYSKAASFSMALLPRFVRENMNVLSSVDVESACRVYAQFIAYRCVELIENKHLKTFPDKWIKSLMFELITFPGTQPA